MKTDLRKEVADMINGSNQKEYLFAITNDIPEVYDVDGKIYSESEFKKLSKEYKMVIKWQEIRSKID